MVKAPLRLPDRSVSTRQISKMPVTYQVRASLLPVLPFLHGLPVCFIVFSCTRKIWGHHRVLTQTSVTRLVSEGIRQTFNFFNKTSAGPSNRKWYLEQ